MYLQITKANLINKQTNKVESTFTGQEVMQILSMRVLTNLSSDLSPGRKTPYITYFESEKGRCKITTIGKKLYFTKNKEDPKKYIEEFKTDLMYDIEGDGSFKSRENEFTIQIIGKHFNVEGLRQGEFGFKEGYYTEITFKEMQ